LGTAAGPGAGSARWAVPPRGRSERRKVAGCPGGRHGGPGARRTSVGRRFWP